MNIPLRWKRMRIVVFISWLLYLLATPVLVNGAAASSIEVLPRWKKGEKVQYEIIKTRRKRQGKSVTMDLTTRTDLEIEVLSKKNDGYVLAWTLGATRFDDPNQAKKRLNQQMSNMLKDQRIILELDSQAVINGVQNWKDLQESSKKILKILTAELNNAGLDPAMIAKVRTQITSMFATKQQIEQLCTREARIFFMALGIELAPSNLLEYEGKLPNSFGGESFPCHAQFALKAVNRKSDRVKISWNQKMLPDDARRIMERTLRDLARRLGKTMPDAEQLKSLTIEDSAEFVLEISTGWIQHVKYARTTRVEGSSQQDETMITRKKE
ncbi:MAG: hypothetical protein SD837_16240 [Candidatus Electrothrix scaldis]|nr:MAG: hypothetical protein SD837_16240 [Candidatus Electrothrix sp. GW3-3]